MQVIEPSRVGGYDGFVSETSNLGTGWWSKNLEDIDREVVRLASICKVPLLNPGIIQRVLDNDATVCGTSNQVAFDKLRQALMMHYHVRDKAVGAMGEAATQDVIAEIVANIQKRLGKQLGGA